MEATPKSAAIAGAWAVFGLVPFDAWTERHPAFSVPVHNGLWLLAGAIFLVVPACFLVLGPDQEPFCRDGLAHPEQRARCGVVMKRMLAWFGTAVVVGVIWSGIVARVVD